MKLREWREFAGYTLAEAGELVGISAVAVFKLEKADNTEGETAKRLRNLYYWQASKRWQAFVDAVAEENENFIKRYNK